MAEHITLSQVADFVSIVAGLITILGLGGLLSWSFFQKSKEGFVDSSISIFVFSIKLGICVLIIWLFAFPAFFLHLFVVLSLGKGHVGGEDFYWADSDWYAYVASYLLNIMIWAPIYVLICASIFTGSLKPFKEFYRRF